MKKSFVLIAGTLILLIQFNLIALAQDSPAPKNPAETETASEPTAQEKAELEFKQKMNLLLPSQDSLFSNTKKDIEDFRLVDGDLEQELAPRVLRILVSFSSLAFFVIFTYAGVRLLLSRGNEEALTKTKELFVQIVIGAILITASFGIVFGIIRFFDAL